MTNFETLRQHLESVGQTQLLRFWDELDDAERSALVADLQSINWSEIDQLTRGQDKATDFAALARAAESPPHVRADGSGASWSLDQARQAGEAALRAGRVGAVLVAGGQGTRLGFDQPKGMFPIGPVSGRTLFQFFADTLMAVSKRYGKAIPWYVMTSEATDAATREYFASENYFGLPEADVMIFRQGTMPAVDAVSGKVLLAHKHRVALSPDGHGGTPGAMHKNGILADAARRGVDLFSYFQVDNPLADVCEPTLLGHHLLAESELTTQVVRKRYPTERVGNVVAVDGAVQIIEYSDLPEEAANATDAAGELNLWAGNIAVHVINRAFLEAVVQKTDALPFHRASKKVPYVNEVGETVTPESPNATKFEKFIFDLLPQAANAFVVEALPEQAFAPVKNADGAATDTPELAKRAISDLHRSWLAECGIVVDREHFVETENFVEISPRVARSAAELRHSHELARLKQDAASLQSDLWLGPQSEDS
ncbi:MAG: UDPGP type 1 family protein [Planctomycetota bacterium]